MKKIASLVGVLSTVAVLGCGEVPEVSPPDYNKYGDLSNANSGGNGGAGGYNEGGFQEGEFGGNGGSGCNCPPGPQGEKGDKGDTGEQGPQGEIGFPGNCESECSKYQDGYLGPSINKTTGKINYQNFLGIRAANLICQQDFQNSEAHMCTEPELLQFMDKINETDGIGWIAKIGSKSCKGGYVYDGDESGSRCYLEKGTTAWLEIKDNDQILKKGFSACGNEEYIHCCK